MKGKLVLVFLVLMTLCLNGCTGGGTSALVGNWVFEEDGDEVVIELREDGTAIFNGSSLKWTAKNGRLTLMSKEDDEDVFSYKLSGSTLTLTSSGIYEDEEGESITFTKYSRPPAKENKITESVEDMQVSMLLSDFERLVDMHARLMEELRGGNISALVLGKTVLEQIQVVLSSLQPKVEKMSPGQRQRFEAAAAKFEKNRLMQ